MSQPLADQEAPLHPAQRRPALAATASRSALCSRTRISAGHLASSLLLELPSGPPSFRPTRERRGVGEPPHAFETVTIRVRRRVEHRDSSAAAAASEANCSGMTAAAGSCTRVPPARIRAARRPLRDGAAVVNLPAKHKLARRLPGDPRRADSRRGSAGRRGSARVIAGELAGAKDRAHLPHRCTYGICASRATRRRSSSYRTAGTTALVGLHGSLRANGAEAIGRRRSALFDRSARASRSRPRRAPRRCCSARADRRGDRRARALRDEPRRGDPRRDRGLPQRAMGPFPIWTAASSPAVAWPWSRSEQKSRGSGRVFQRLISGQLHSSSL